MKNFTPRQLPTTGLSTSKKAKALLIALVNLNLVFAVLIFKPETAVVAGQMITAILFLAGLFIGTQGGIDMTAAWKSNTNIDKVDATVTNITKKYQYKMDYADGADS